MTTSTAPRIFVSHSHHDNAFCRAFVAGLRNVGLDIWYDEHNLGWGALRQAIEREMAAREHFIAILSPAAVASEWVNAEIDGALDLLRDGALKSFLLVLAAPCNVPLLLRRYKRVEGPGGTPVNVAEAVGRTVSILVPTAPVVAQVGPKIVIPPERFPRRLADLGFAPRDDDSAEHIVPPLCAVPAGPFLMGSDPKRDNQATDPEKPQHSITLPAYAIAGYPVTVAEYACFVRAGQRQPSDWPRQLGILDHPVVYVSWHDAVAYAAWLAKQTGQPWRLPSEAEWEKAARGADGRRYPWGDAFDKNRCNTSESGLKTTTAVGAYAERNDASPYGAHDLAGNVWEWCSSLYKPYPYTMSDGRENANSTENRVLRGGSWNFNPRDARAAGRYASAPGNLDIYLGFRLAVVAAGG